MVQRRRFSAEYKREAVAMLKSPGVSVSQIAAELGIGATVLGRWRRELRQGAAQAFPGPGRSRDEEVARCDGSWPASPRSGIFCEKRQRSSRAHRDEVSDDPTMPRYVFHPDDVPVLAGLPQWILWLGDSAPKWAGPGERPITHTDSSVTCRPGRRRGEPANLGRSALRRQAVWSPPRGAPDAPGRTARRAAAAAVAQEARRGS